MNETSSRTQKRRGRPPLTPEQRAAKVRVLHRIASAKDGDTNEPLIAWRELDRRLRLELGKSFAYANFIALVERGLIPCYRDTLRLDRQRNPLRLYRFSEVRDAIVSSIRREIPLSA